MYEMSYAIGTTSNVGYFGSHGVDLTAFYYCFKVSASDNKPPNL